MSRRIEYVALSEVKRARRNPKRHDGAAIAASLTRFGIGELPLIDGRTGLLVAGEGRVNQLLALKEQNPHRPPDGVTINPHGEWMVPVIAGWSSADDKEADAYLIASNRLSERGGWDGLGLAEMLVALNGELDGLGYSHDELDDLLHQTGYTDLPSDGDGLDSSLPAVPQFSSTPDGPAVMPAPAPAPRSPFGEPAEHTAPAAQTGPPVGSMPALDARAEPATYQLAWAASHEQRETIYAAIRQAREQTHADAAVAALTVVCQFYLDYAGEH